MEIKQNKLSFIIAFAVFTVFISVLSVSVSAADSWTESTADITSMDVYVNEALVWQGSCVYQIGAWDCVTENIAAPAIERGEDIEVKTVFTAGNDTEKVKVKTWISGYYKDIEAETNVFDLYVDNSYTKTLELEIPNDVEATDDYTLHVEIEQRKELTGVDTADITTKVQRASNLLEILSADVYSASEKLEAGELCYVDVVVKNRGNYEAEDVYVNVEITELGLIKTVYLGDLGENDDDDEDAEDTTVVLYLPAAAKGSYMLKVSAYNNKASTSVVKNIVISEERATEGIVITPGATVNNIEPGAGAVYTVNIVNFGSISQDFSIAVEGTEGWATVQVNPQTFSLEAGESETVNIYVVAGENAIAAEHVFSVKILYGGAEEQCSFTADITGQDGQEISTTGIRAILIVIAVILAIVIIVLLIVLLTRKESKETEETYY